MTGADLFMIRETLGLSKNEAAKRLGVLRRTLTEWEDEDRAIPEGVAQTVLDWEAEYLDRIGDVLEMVEQTSEDEGEDPEEIDLGVYRDGEYHFRVAGDGMTLTEHTALVRGIRLGLRLADYEVATHWIIEEPGA